MPEVFFNVVSKYFKLGEAVDNNCFSRRNGLKGRVALNKNLAFLKFRLYEVTTRIFSLIKTCCVSGRRLRRPRKLERPVHDQGDQHQERNKESDVPKQQGQQGPADGHHPGGHPGAHPRGYQREDRKVQKGHRGASSEATHLLLSILIIIQEATYNEKLPDLSRKQQDAIKQEKLNSAEEVEVFFQIMILRRYDYGSFVCLL